MKRTTTQYVRIGDEIIQHLEPSQDISSDLPETIVGYWREAVGAYKKSDYPRAETLCKRIAKVLSRMRSGDVDFRQVDKAQALVSILAGTIYLDQKDLTAASYYFELGAKRLRHWDEKLFESLAYYGRTLTHTQEKNWSAALEAAQKALDAIHQLHIPDRSNQTKQLEEQIKAEIKTITQASVKEEMQSSEILKPVRPKPTEPIPIVRNFSNKEVTLSDNVSEYIWLDDDYRNGADFGVQMEDNSMNGYGILSGDIVLIRQEPEVKTGEVAAIVIMTPEIEPVEVIKAYYEYNKQENMKHWLLRSNNPSSEHLVVMPSGVDEKAILDLYVKEVQSGRMRKPPKYYEDAEITKVGEYVGLLRKI